MTWLWLLLLFIFASPVSASPSVTIVTFPSVVIIGDSFPITFSVGNTSGVSYHYKIISGTATDLVTQPNSSCDSAYDSCETLNVADTSTTTATAYAKITSTTGSFDIKIRIAQSDLHSKTYDSSIIFVNSISPSPIPTLIPSLTPTPTVTPTATPVPTSTNTPTPTNTPTITPTITPTKLPTITPMPTLGPTETPYFEPTPNLTSPPNQLLGIQDLITPTVSSAKAASSKINPQLISYLFILIGGGLLTIPLVVAKLST